MRESSAIAEEALEVLQVYYPGGLSEEEEARLALLRAWMAYREGRYDEAERLYGELAQPAIDGDDTVQIVRAALAGLGWTYAALGMGDEAAGVARRLRDCGDEAEAAAIRARAELERGQREAAETWARHALDVGRSPLVISAAHDVLANVERARGRLDEAVNTARTALAIVCDHVGLDDPFVCDPLITLACIEAELGVASAIDRFARALRLRLADEHPGRKRAREAFIEAFPELQATHLGR